MISKVVYFLEYPYSARDHARFGIETLLQNGFEVEVWDFVPFLRPTIFEKIHIPDPIEFKGHRQFFSLEEALESIALLNPSSYGVILLVDWHKTIPLFQAFAKIKLKFMFPETNLSPDPVFVAPVLRDRLSRLTWGKLYSRFLRPLSLPPKQLGHPVANAVLASGKKSLTIGLKRFPRYIDASTSIVWAHNLDYDLVLQKHVVLRDVPHKFITFLDQYLPTHPEWTYSNLATPITANEYYPLICAFFDRLERDLGLPVVVAAHPRASYSPELFGNRPIHYGQTAKLVRQSEFVITHSSAAVNFAVLMGKPIMLMTTRTLQRHFLEGDGLALAQWLNKKSIIIDNIDGTVDWAMALTIDENAYRRFREEFLKVNGTPEKPCWQIFADYLKTL